jgi:hypothetical protein
MENSINALSCGGECIVNCLQSSNKLSAVAGSLASTVPSECIQQKFVANASMVNVVPGSTRFDEHVDIVASASMDNVVPGSTKFDEHVDTSLLIQEDFPVSLDCHNKSLSTFVSIGGYDFFIQQSLTRLPYVIKNSQKFYNVFNHNVNIDINKLQQHLLSLVIHFDKSSAIEDAVRKNKNFSWSEDVF